MSAKKDTVVMTEGPILLPVIRFTIPAIAMGILQLLFNSVDLAVVGSFTEGEEATAAVGGCGALINLIVNMFMGLSVGSGILAAQYFGAKRQEDVRKIINTSVTASFICGCLIGVFGFLMAGPLLRLMATPDDVIVEAVPYMRAYFCGMPGFFIYNFMASILRSYGDTKHPLIFLSIAGISNVIMNLITVIGFGMGAVGVGIATAVSQYISAAMIIIFMLKPSSPCRITGLKVDFPKLLKIIKIGIPASLQGMVFSLSNVLIQSTVNGYGKIVMAGNSAGSSLDGFIYISVNSVYYATLTFVGQNVGAMKFERIKKIVLVCLGVVTSIGIFMTSIIVGFGPHLLKLYASGENQGAVIAAGMNRLKAIGIPYFLCGFMEVGCGLMRGMGKTIEPMIISVIGSCLFRIIWIYTVCPLAPTNIFVLYVSYPISWILTAGAHFICSSFVYKKLVKNKSLLIK